MAFDNPQWEEFNHRVKEATDILSVVSAYVPLKRKGNRYWGRCPFHGEDTPSFSVVPERGLFYCFGCHTGGDAFKFLSLMEHISYFEALKVQAEKLGISLPEQHRSSKEIAQERKIEDLRRIETLARDFFHSCLLNTSYGIPAKAYLQKRGIGKQEIRSLGLGFAPPAWDKLVRAFQKRGISRELLLDSGLAKEGKRENSLYDAFRNRVMIPIADARGRVVAFGGRVLDDSLPKYLNSPETLIFNKKRLLYGLDRAHRAIAREGRAIVVEGYMDAISVSLAGVENVVASLGTAFTIEQCRLLLRYAPEICFCYDSDRAGQQATLRALGIIRETGATMKVLRVPDGKDPDEYIRKHGAEAFKKLVDEAVPISTYHIEYILREADYSSLQGRLEALQELLPVLRALESETERNLLIPRIAQALTFNEGDIRQEMRKFQKASIPILQGIRNTKPKGTPHHATHMQKKQDAALVRAGRILLATLWQEVGIRQKLLESLPSDAFFLEEQRILRDYVEDKTIQGEVLSTLDVEATYPVEVTQELSRALAETLTADERSVQHKQEIIHDAQRTLRKAYLSKQYAYHMRQADAMEKEGGEGFFAGTITDTSNKRGNGCAVDLFMRTAAVKQFIKLKYRWITREAVSFETTDATKQL